MTGNTFAIRHLALVIGQLIVRHFDSSEQAGAKYSREIPLTHPNLTASGFMVYLKWLMAENKKKCIELLWSDKYDKIEREKSLLENPTCHFRKNGRTNSCGALLTVTLGVLRW